MDDLLKYNNYKFSATMDGTYCEGIISVEDYVYLCQDYKNGDICNDKKGYKYSWNVLFGTKKNLKDNIVENFKLICPNIIMQNLLYYYK